MIIRSIAQNSGKIVLVLQNHGTLDFRRPGPNGTIVKIRKHHVWSVAEINHKLTSTPLLTAHLRKFYGPTCAGLFADDDLMPLGDPALADEIVAESIQDAHDATMARWKREHERREKLKDEIRRGNPH